MRKIYLIFIFMHTVLNQAQTLSCGTEQYYLPNQTNLNSSTQTPQLYDDSYKHVFNLKFHVVYNDNGITRTSNLGQEGLTIGFNEVMNAVRVLNINFNQFNIFFKYKGFDTINNTSWLNYGLTTERTNIFNSSFNETNAINIFIINNVEGPAAVAGYYGYYSIFDDEWFVRPWTLCHELGHNFGLLHTFFNNGECEHAARTPTPPNTPFFESFNASTTGDRIIDTFPYLNSVYSDSNCNYLGGASDCRGTAIVSQTVNGFFINGQPANNFMTTESVDIT